jgi:hypothetical protein
MTMRRMMAMLKNKKSPNHRQLVERKATKEQVIE